MKSHLGWLCAFAPLALAQSPAQKVGATIDDWHQAASVSDEARYFAHFAPNGVFMCTDSSERWTAAEFRAWAKPAFARKVAWNFRAKDRKIEFWADGKIAWFDEMLETPNLGLCRGSGVLVRIGKEWKIAQYNLSAPIPNGMVAEVVKRIAAAGK